ncbi:hypothetical protein BB559_007269 [Furculomyces boomerangus]|uniref:Prefoldin, alpha subunit n=1 Tax=Furculomyces boomerangus TaxID=61424 RepID=A0A2T9XXY9_9FUNG|nr:hypothetical protein BB559_007269 [Furculomyces boomerangus]
MSNPPNQSQQIKIEDLSVAQLNSLKEQFESDISNLTKMYGKLRQAQATFIECTNCLKSLENDDSKKVETKVLVPLTNSLYVRGRLEKNANVVVDVGTGYYIEKSTNDSKIFYNKKIEYIQNNSDKLLKTINEKQQNFQALLEIMKVKMYSQEQGQNK